VLWNPLEPSRDEVKHAGEVVDILEVFALTGSLRDAARLAGCSPMTVARCVRLRETGRLPTGRSARRDQLVDPHLAKVEEWVERSHGRVPVEPPPLSSDLIRLLFRLRLRYIRQAGPAILARASEEGWDYVELLKVLLAEEATGRDRAIRVVHRKTARLPSGKTFDAWDPKASAIPGHAQWALRSLDWVGRAENLFLVGPSGTRKSHFAEAIAHAAIDRDLRASWFTQETLTATIARSRIDVSTGKVVERIVRLCGRIDQRTWPARSAASASRSRRLIAARRRSARRRSASPPTGGIHCH